MAAKMVVAVIYSLERNSSKRSEINQCVAEFISIKICMVFTKLHEHQKVIRAFLNTWHPAEYLSMDLVVPEI
jgi:hypothetical protein